MSIGILEEIAGKTRIRVEKAKAALPMEEARKKALFMAEEERQAGCDKFPFERAIAMPGLSFICEVKRASPSKGIIAADFPYLQIAREYEAAGAAAVSVLTEPDYFLGKDEYLREIAAAVRLPTLRKDFVVDPFQIYQGKILGAKATLLICALLDPDTLGEFINIAGELGLSCLVEIHNEEEAERALTAGARIIGINNRDLKTFTVDLGLTAKLRAFVPRDVLTVTESGISSPNDISALKGLDLDAALIGESMMRSADKGQFLREMKAAYTGSCGED